MSRQVKKARHKKERVQRWAKLTHGGRDQESGYLWEVWSEGGQSSGMSLQLDEGDGACVERL